MSTAMQAEQQSALLPCPFCGHDTPEFERMGTSGQSCIVACGNCGARHESGDEYLRSGSSWNTRAALSHPSTPQGWQPISSAPKDGTDVIVMHVCIDTQIVHNAFWIPAEETDDDEEVGWWSYEHSEVSRIKLDGWLAPTHWQPLPPPPEQGGPNA